MITSIELSKIVPLDIEGDHPNPSRRTSNTTGLQGSIKEVGLVTPVRLMRISDDEYQILSGARRVTACKALGWTHIQAEVVEYDEEIDPLSILAAANVQMEFTHLEKARLSLRLAEQGKNQNQTARTLGETVSTIELYAKLLDADEGVQKLVDSGKMSLSTFRTISCRPEKEQREIVAKVKVRNEDGRLTRNAVKAARKRHDAEKTGDPMIGDEVTVQSLAKEIDANLEKLSTLYPYEASEQTILRYFLKRFETWTDETTERINAA